MAAANDLRKGMCIRYNSNPAIVLEVQHRTPGNLRAFVQAIIRYIGTGKSADVRFGSTDKVETVDVERKELEFSYKDPTGFHFMDMSDYEQLTLPAAQVGDSVKFLKDNTPVQLIQWKGKLLDLELPQTIEFAIAQTDPGLKGDTAQGGSKPATLETGAVVTVPLFVNENDIIRVDTRTGQYIERVK